MKIERFEDLKSWVKAQELGVLIYTNFNKIKDYSFKDQICRAAVSVSNNIAEGFHRGTNKEFARFLFIARGSNSEVKSMLYMAKSLNYIDTQSFETAIPLCEEVGKMLNSFISYLNKNEKSTNSTNQTNPTNSTKI